MSTEQTNESKINELRTIKIDDKHYDIKSLTERGTNLISNIQRVDTVIERHQLELSISQLAKAKLLEELVKEVPKFKEVVPQ